MLEREVERKLVKAVRDRKGVCWKFVSPGTAGVPDRIILMPAGRIAFVEVKKPGETPRKLQLSRHRLLRRLGFKVFVLDKAEEIGGILDEIQTT
ncbi:VRR-NUC domain-containing protein [Ruminococcus sp.]|uniref:VRR-NUC domain-containing protein n=1 Tax=Ruminococcus sp. TaxID=41978 RepID=UPI0025DEF9B8|nr:VRR-NUC domain-containing protein [Ruminococcus sp.]